MLFKWEMENCLIKLKLTYVIEMNWSSEWVNLEQFESFRFINWKVHGKTKKSRGDRNDSVFWMR